MKGKPIEPGCLALIVRAKNCKENIGRVVRVLRKTSPGEPLPGSTVTVKQRPWAATVWFVEALPGHPNLTTPVIGTVTGQLKRKESLRIAAISERNLIRLDGDEEPKTVSTAHTKDLDEVI
jgi:hypothetical protein